MSEPHRLSGTVLWLLGRAAQRGHALARERLEAGGIRKWHYAVLAALKEFGQQSQAEIGRRLHLDRSDMVAVLNDLQADDYVTREPDPADRRRNVVTISDTGAAALARFDRLIAEADDLLLADLSEAERDQLVAMLERIAQV
ncbi:MarR family winged helix-turn-helix transcriptional regulator [Kutzneria sp. 744]|jgi:DNA-binding MarR family transcriptional regulator|uniref:MarR family winged helix-turn-helix transcriptional regulator n=1 Tax=Kutzneria sp. (strain 744) TaxID=345341 RepID=UPI0003EEDCD7|nr:MarR family transcriptional regulator [Kutzneria sp. 744]EWM16277.1 transcriptional regulator, MarR family [Kutzneria sp. 744]